jgi:hypothetical protein
MPEKTMKFTAVSSAGAAYTVDFPLHPETRSSAQVAELLSAVLAALSEIIDRDRDVSDGDVLQALAMAAAIRSRLVDAPVPVTRRLLDQLVGDALEAVAHASRVSAGRA